MEVGYKVFNPDWTCRDFQYEVGETYEIESEPILCSNGFHYCLKLVDCFRYYDFNPKNKVAKIIAHGIIDGGNKDNKHCTNKIEIVEEISWYEVLDMVNSGSGNSGHSNSGNSNSGDDNSGDWNSGNRNSGDYNSGYRNSGDYNSGDYNSGYRNSGDYNSGDRNSGNLNSGYRNSGDYNSGNSNSGDYNSGDWNTTNHSSGVFNTKEEKITMFNKKSDWTFKDWDESEARSILMTMPIPYTTTKFVTDHEMTETEKAEHSEYTVLGGYLKVVYKDVGKQEWWNNLSEANKEKVMSLPNFDKNIFKECTGITIL